MFNIQKLEKIEYRGQPVVTTATLAEIYHATEKNIKDNFYYNRRFFEEGVDYFVLEGSELNRFKTDNSVLGINDKIRRLYLWGEKSCLRHAKCIAQGQQGWVLFNQLIDIYFHARDKHRQETALSHGMSELEKAPDIKADFESAKFVAEFLDLSQDSKLKMAKQILENHNQQTNILPDYSENQKIAISLTDCLNKFDITHLGARIVNKKLEDAGIIVKEFRTSRKSGKQKGFWVVRNEYFGRNDMAAQATGGSQPHYYIDTFLEMMELAMCSWKSI